MRPDPLGNHSSAAGTPEGVLHGKLVGGAGGARGDPESRESPVKLVPEGNADTAEPRGGLCEPGHGLSLGPCL